MKVALITGITGQDGSYLAELLLEKGYEVHGIVRRSSSFNRGRIDHLSDPEKYTAVIQENPILHHGDLTDSSSVENIMKSVKPDEIYNLAAQSHVRISFDVPENTANVVALGNLRILEAMRKFCPDAKFYQASSSEMFGKVSEIPQNEKTPFYPRSPYACAKVHAFHTTINYRDSYKLHASNGILFNHESERRGESFVTRKITRNLARIKVGMQKSFSLGNLNSERDWGHARDYVKSMWLILQQPEPGDYAVGTGEKHSVREFLEEAARCLGMKIKSNGERGVDEKYLDENGNVIITINPFYFRPAEVDTLQADCSKARSILGWEPKIKFRELVGLMVNHDLSLAQKEAQINQRIKTF
jgi:GDPmannose 4,6-dehydratase